MQYIKELNVWYNLRVYRKRGVDEERAHYSRHTVPDKLRRDQGEYSNGRVGDDVVIEVLRCKNAYCYCGCRGCRGHDRDGHMLFDV